MVTETEFDEEGEVVWPFGEEEAVDADDDFAKVEENFNGESHHDDNCGIEGDNPYDENADDQAEPNAEAQAAKTMTMPRQPTVVDRLKDEVSHLPTETWCVHCTAGKSHDEPHFLQSPKTEADVHLVSFDYGKMKTELDEEGLPLLVGEQSNSGSGLALLAEHESPPWLAAALDGGG